MSNPDESGSEDEVTTEPTGDQVIDLSAMTEDELRARHSDLGSQIEALEAQPRTIARAQQINALKTERGLTVDAVEEMSALAASAPDDRSIDAPEAADAAADAEAPAEATTTTTEGEAPATTEGTNIIQEDTVSDTSTPEPTGSEITQAVAAAEQFANDGAMAGVTASAADRPNGPTIKPVRVAFTAGADQHQFTQGYELDDDAKMHRAWESVRLQAPAHGPVQAIVAGLPAFEDMGDSLGLEILKSANGVQKNDALIAESVDAFLAKKRGAAMPAGVTAAICEPLDIIREIPNCGVEDTPFTNLFPQRPIGRLGFTFTPGSTLAAVDGAINIWTQDDQDDIVEGTPSTWKPCIPIECLPPDTVTAEELVTCVTVDTSTEMSSPERVQEFQKKLRVQRARRREQYQLSLFDATASNFTFAAHAGYGAVPTFFEAVYSMLPKLVYTERLDETDYDVVIEPGYLEKLAIDRHNQCNPNELPGAKAETLAYIRQVLGLNVVSLRDFSGASPFQALPTPGGSAAVLAALPQVNTVRFVPAASYIYGSTGEESTGWQTDPQLARQNLKQMFSAEWILLAKHGCAPAATLSINSLANGGRGGCSEVFETIS